MKKIFLFAWDTLLDIAGSTFVSTVAKIGGFLAVLLVVLSITMPDLVADSAGHFWFLQSRTRVQSYNTGLDRYLFVGKNKDGTVRFYVDSAGALSSSTIVQSGLATTDSIYDKGDFRQGVSAQNTGRFEIVNGVVRPYILELYNSRGTKLWGIDSLGYAFSTTTVIDSFSTTSATDTIALSSTPGFTTSTKVFVSQWNPTWSTTVDTAIYSGQVVITGAGNTRLVISRVKSYTGNGATAVKSGAQYIAKLEK